MKKLHIYNDLHNIVNKDWKVDGNKLTYEYHKNVEMIKYTIEIDKHIKNNYTLKTSTSILDYEFSPLHTYNKYPSSVLYLLKQYHSQLFSIYFSIVFILLMCLPLYIGISILPYIFFYVFDYFINIIPYRYLRKDIDNIIKSNIMKNNIQPNSDIDLWLKENKTFINSLYI